jgi:hypothetical protein
MFVKTHTEKSALKGNTGSSSNLFEYLEKENEDKMPIDKEFFFNEDNPIVDDERAMREIDNNVKGLGKDEYKFFMVSVNPNQNELKHLARLASGKDVNDISELTKSELTTYNNLFKEYVNQVMNDYAKSFNRKSRDLTNKDLLYFAKVEQQRTYKGFDLEVKEGRAKVGDLKPGLQTHSHVVVSRKTKDMEMRISPNAKSRGHSDKHKLNGKNVNVGFDNVQFKVSAENTFDDMFGYQRKSKDKVFNQMLKEKPELRMAYDALDKTESVLNPRRAINKAVNKALQNNDRARAIYNNAMISRTLLKPKAVSSMVVSKAANITPATAVINKAWKVAKAAKRIVSKGLDI